MPTLFFKEKKMKEFRDKLDKLIHDAGEALGYNIIEWQYIPGRRGILRVYISKEEGYIGIGDCKRFNEYLGAMLDIEDPIEGSYTLEISSPGVNRELRSERDYRLAKGKWVVVITKEPIDGMKEFRGYLKEVTAEGIVIEVRGCLHEIRSELILKGRMDTPLFSES